MTTARSARLALAALWFATCAPAGSQTSTAAANAGVSGTGTLDVSTAFGGSQVQLTGDVAFEVRGAQQRLDILSIGIAGAPGGATFRFLPKGGLTLVFDRTHALYTIWVPSQRVYFTGKPPLPNAQATPVPAPSASPRIASNPFDLIQGLSTFQALSMGFDLTGHDVIDGHPATEFSYHFDATDKSGSETHVHGTAAFADDVGDAPLRLTVAYKGKGIPDSTASIAVSALQQRPLPDADFAPPPGYVRVKALNDLMGGGALPFPPH